MRKLLDRLDLKRTASNLFVVITAVVFYMLLAHLPSVRAAISDVYSYISPLVGGVVIAYILNPIAGLFSNKMLGKMKNRRAARSIGVTITIFSVLAALVLLLWAVIPELITSCKRLITEMDSYFDSFKVTLERFTAKYQFIEINVDELVGSWREMLKKLTDWVIGNIDRIIDASYQFGMGVFDGLITFVISVYILYDMDNFVKGLKRFFMAVLKEDVYRRVSGIAKKSDRILKSYLGGNLIDSLIIGIANFIFMVIFSMPAPGLISVIVGVTNYIPTFGPFIGAIPSTFIILIIDPGAALWFVIFTVVLQQIDGNVIKPLLFGESTGIGPLWVLVSIVVFGRMFDIVGMLLGVPVFAIMTLIYDEVISRRFAQRNIADVYCPKVDRKVSWVQRLLDRRGRGKSKKTGKEDSGEE